MPKIFARRRRARKESREGEPFALVERIVAEGRAVEKERWAASDRVDWEDVYKNLTRNGLPKNLAPYPSANEILALDKARQIPVLLAAIEALASAKGTGFEPPLDWYDRGVLFVLCSRLLRGRLPYEEADILALIGHSITYYRRAAAIRKNVLSTGITWKFPGAGVMGSIERYVTRHGLSDAVARALARYLRTLQPSKRYLWTDEVADLIDRNQALLSPEEVTPPPLLEEDRWGRQVRQDIEGLGGDAASQWRAVLEHAKKSSRRGQPTEKWINDAQEMAAAIGRDAFLRRVTGWVNDCDLMLQNDDVVKGLIWWIGLTAGDDAAPGLGALCRKYFTKSLGTNLKLGNACLWALGRLDGMAGIGQLALLRRRVRYPSARQKIEEILYAAAARTGLSRLDLEEIGIPDFGFDRSGLRCDRIGDYTAESAITPTNSVSISWIRADGKRQKSVPAAVKTAEAEAIKELRRRTKQVRDILSGSARRVEESFLTERDWDYGTWRERFADHPLMSRLTRRLIWRLTDGKRNVGVLATADGVEDIGGEVLSPKPSDRICLWHPMDRPVEEVLAWRERLAEKEISQPFKQAHREIYVLTDAERATSIYSNRFAAHILRQHYLPALCHQRGWTYDLQGDWDCGDTAVKRIPEGRLAAEFQVNRVEGSASETGFFELVVSDQVRFHDEYRNPVGLEEIPPVLLSEVMRDVDLFVAVSSVGSDPNWVDGGPEGLYDVYWRESAFGDLSATAKTRHAALKGILPRLKIADQCTLHDRFLSVRGTRNTYRIHLGSANVLMDPGDRYLCLLPNGRARLAAARIWLPFEGDTTLSIILSKALLLAKDEKITDPVILEQL